ncbi:hypothetical protein CABS01_02797 [Colletotrichum abscissum]|uniref:uncharacterized protein n=1 Tax=Colletotrichum abscissum TaxID=1671311 RepID=UPI0027D6989A|nr:uncharacterized protein CABS01_02797 [Colletotrichum abscissum]KAK1483061.1 hypothetical protein CABS01_02797 [Colletotrichum abscissum]
MFKLNTYIDRSSQGADVLLLLGRKNKGTRFNMRFAAIVTTLALLIGFAAVAPAAPGNAVEPRQTRDGFYCQECVNGKKDCVACTDGTCLGWAYDC